ncbi:hypothetical protein BGZ60DRAFT_568147 [Tricladium varicosporioides]|nr:hypothetical protein BGZ60DRAFT_568147 [Hymenoscyphus varicosporioides]
MLSTIFTTVLSFGLISSVNAAPATRVPPTDVDNVVYLVNCEGGAGHSAIAYYTANEEALRHEQPDQLALVGGTGAIHWEGVAIEGNFPNGMTFTSHIDADAFLSVTLGNKAGTGESETKDYICYKEYPFSGVLDLLYTDDNLGVCKMIYYCA